MTATPHVPEPDDAAPLAVRRLTPAELLEELAVPWTDEAWSPLHGGGLVVVEQRRPLDAGSPTAAAAAAIPADRPRNFVLVVVDPDGALPTGLEGHADVLLTAAASPPAPWVAVGDDTVEAVVDELAAAVQASPMASVALAQLLSVGERATLEQAVVLESLTYSTLLGGPEFLAWRAARPVKVRPADPRPLVRVERFADELHVALSRARVHNAYSAALRDELVEALRLVAADRSLRRVVLRGEGPSFCSGGDLDEFGTTPDPATAHLVRWARSAAVLVHRSADRIEAHLHGACIGAGIEIPAAAGRVVARADTVIQLPEVAMGLVPGAGGTATIPRRIGRHRTCFMGLTGRRIDPATARAWGLVDDVVDELPDGAAAPS